MVRGRARAKQVKIARELKYQSHETDFGALAKELHGENPDADEVDDDDDDSGELDKWSDYANPSRD